MKISSLVATARAGEIEARAANAEQQARATARAAARKSGEEAAELRGRAAAKPKA